MAILRTTPGTIQETPCGRMIVGETGLVTVSRKWVEPLVAMGFELVDAEGDSEPQPDDIVEAKSLAGRKTKRIAYSRTEDEV